ncbi:MAG: hypothetical protein F6K65_33110 [Moorea sp. SIO3C2]|nr:hypothetical protein [Moorena sp. SIO3C2]
MQRTYYLDVGRENGHQSLDFYVEDDEKGLSQQFGVDLHRFNDGSTAWMFQAFDDAWWAIAQCQDLIAELGALSAGEVEYLSIYELEAIAQRCGFVRTEDDD